MNDTQVGDGSTQYRPALSVAPNGRLDLVYYDRREDSKDILNEVSYQASFDEGESFSERVPISDESFSSRIGFGSDRGLPDLGSRLGLVSTDERAMAVWSDTRAGTPRTSKQDIARGLVGSAIRRGWRAGSRPSCAGRGRLIVAGLAVFSAPGARARQAVRPGRAR